MVKLYFVTFVIFVHLISNVEDGYVWIHADNILVITEEVVDVHDGGGHPPSPLVVELIKCHRTR